MQNHSALGSVGQYRLDEPERPAVYRYRHRAEYLLGSLASNDALSDQDPLLTTHHQLSIVLADPCRGNRLWRRERDGPCCCSSCVIAHPLLSAPAPSLLEPDSGWPYDRASWVTRWAEIMASRICVEISLRAAGECGISIVL